MTALRITTDGSGDIIAEVTVTSGDVTQVQPAGDGLLAFEVWADEPARVRVVASAQALGHLLRAAHRQLREAIR